MRAARIFRPKPPVSVLGRCSTRDFDPCRLDFFSSERSWTRVLGTGDRPWTRLSLCFALTGDRPWTRFSLHFTGTPGAFHNGTRGNSNGVFRRGTRPIGQLASLDLGTGARNAISAFHRGTSRRRDSKSRRIGGDVEPTTRPAPHAADGSRDPCSRMEQGSALCCSTVEHAAAAADSGGATWRSRIVSRPGPVPPSRPSGGRRHVLRRTDRAGSGQRQRQTGPRGGRLFSTSAFDEGENR